MEAIRWVVAFTPMPNGSPLPCRATDPRCAVLPQLRSNDDFAAHRRNRLCQRTVGISLNCKCIRGVFVMAALSLSKLCFAHHATASALR